ncbi:hypothetical protein GCM10011344_42300 [Dokdonia pacifica]|uniref:Uncharacterized protein n=1 Tax=Dokdonia pacifica TaxID=1627892 RepID=A0A239DL63_9FLAO|nr:hypothetical protein [Dokdonia pacifica]GGG36976.1 hypothetical protein GCM10011344_42300 [Dokdonia pacifica]SNS33210.1 hypothetical protein SAMN06265376_11179 [Dokdonia pacifica]
MKKRRKKLFFEKFEIASLNNISKKYIIGGNDGTNVTWTVATNSSDLCDPDDPDGNDPEGNN